MRIIIIFLFFFTLLKSQQIDTTTINIDEIIQQDETPLRFRIEYTPQDTENPNIEYEDIQLPYQLYISSELTKLKLNYKLLTPQDLSKKDIKILFFKDYYFLNLDIKNLKNKNGFELSTYSKKLLVSKDNVNFSCLKNHYHFNHYTLFEKLILKNELHYISQCIENYTHQLNYSLEINRIFSESIIFSILPYLQYNFSKELNVNNLFYKNDINLDIFIHDKIITGLNFSLLNNYTFFNTNLILKNYPIENFYFDFVIGTEKNIKKIYYKTKLYKNIFNFNTTFIFKKSIYYDFIKEYFINFAEVYFKENIKYLPETKTFEASLGYNYKNYIINIIYNQTLYDYYPTYIFLDGKVETYSVEDLKEKSLTYKFELPFKNISLFFELTQIIHPKEILFKPKLTTTINILGDITKNLYFEQKFLYNNKTLIDNSNNYLDENIVSFTELKYFFNENVAFNIMLNFPVNSKHFITPNIYYSSYFLCGINLKFK